MPHEIKWLLEGHVLAQRYWGDLEIAELKTAMEVVYGYLNTVERPLMHAILDMRESKYIPSNIAAVKEATQDVYRHPKMGWILIHGRNDFLIRFMGNLSSQLFKARFRVLETEAEAIMFLKTVDVMAAPKLDSLDQRLTKLQT